MLWNDAITAGIYDWRNGVRPSFCVATIIRTECPLWVRKRTFLDAVLECALGAGQVEASGIDLKFRCPLYPQYEVGALDEDAQAADLLQEYEAKIAALERMVGRQALEIEFLKGALKNAPRPRNANTSVIVGPAASPSQKDAG